MIALQPCMPLCYSLKLHRRITGLYATLNMKQLQTAK